MKKKKNLHFFKQTKSQRIVVNLKGKNAKDNYLKYEIN